MQHVSEDARTTENFNLDFILFSIEGDSARGFVDPLMDKTVRCAFPVFPNERQGDQLLYHEPPIAELVSRTVSFSFAGAAAIRLPVNYNRLHCKTIRLRGSMKFTELVDSEASKTRQHEYLVDGEQIAITVRIPKNLKTAAAEAASLKGLSLSAFARMCNFYLAFSKANALRSELTWTHYRVLPRVHDDDARFWY